MFPVVAENWIWFVCFGCKVDISQNFLEYPGKRGEKIRSYFVKIVIQSTRDIISKTSGDREKVRNVESSLCKQHKPTKFVITARFRGKLVNQHATYTYANR